MNPEDERWTNGPTTRRRRPVPPKSARQGKHRCPECRGFGWLPGMVKIQGPGKGAGSDFGPCFLCGGSGWVPPPDADALDPEGP